jgi:CheY-like chemotaxis protein
MASPYFGSGKTVLVVDDQPDFCESMEHLLGTLGFRTVCATDGREALAKLHKERIDVILTDLFMPIMDGIELIQNLAQSETPAPPIIATTGDVHFAAQSVGSVAAALGAKAVLMKPFSREQLASAIGFVCSSLKPATSTN